MEENKTIAKESEVRDDEQQQPSLLNLQVVMRFVILYWKWFVLSMIICLGLAAVYLRYTTPTFQVVAKMLIKDDSKDNKSGSALRSNTLGVVANSEGITNEMQLLQSRSLATEVVHDLKLYVNYATKGRVTNRLAYKNQPLNVDIDEAHLQRLNCSINLNIKRTGSGYDVSGTYSVPTNEEGCEGPYSLNRHLSALPAQIATRAGIISIDHNPLASSMKVGDELLVSIVSPRMAAGKYVGELSVSQPVEYASIAQLAMIDESRDRAIDYLEHLTVVYNRQANEDKDAVAHRTEDFINSRLAKIDGELGSTEGQIQNFKERNNMVSVEMSSGSSFSNQNTLDQQLVNAETQIELLNNIAELMNKSGKNFQVIPTNVGLTDGSSTQLISKYNELVLERNRLLRSASESSPVVEPITDQLREMRANIDRAIKQNRKNLEIQRDAIASQYGKYTSEVQQAPKQEREFNEMGRQQEVKSSIYLMLLQKREENSISLATTVDKGKLIDEPQYAGTVSPRRSMIYGIGLGVGFIIPTLIFFLVIITRYKIEGHDDVAKLTRLPIIADVAVASDQAKTKADIVVHENQNNHMEEVFRSMRTNLQFMLKDGEKVVMFTSTSSGEGKTFNCANLAISFALLGKKVILVGLDIRKPRLAELFEIRDHHHGITPLLTRENPTDEEVKAQILGSGVNDNLDLLMAGPIPPNPTELVSRKSLEKVFDILKKHYDYVLIDTAPVGLVTDTLMIGRVADATVYVCRADYTPRASFDLINGLAEERKLPNMAVVINGIDMTRKKYGYYYGYGKYGKYGKYGHYGRGGSYGKYGRYGSYGNYGNYGSYGHYGKYGNYGGTYGKKGKDTSIKQ